MRIVSWNVNGLRAIITKGFYDVLASLKPDIMCLQEIKANEDQVNLDLASYHHYWNSAEKKGYSGTSVFTKPKPLRVSTGLGNKLVDREGRVITAEYEEFILVNVYTPNVKSDLSRLQYRQEEWDPAFLSHLNDLQKYKPVVVCGDLNVAHQEIDLKNDRSNRGNAGFTDEERAGFDKLLASGFIDVFRYRYPDKEAYTWWSYRANAREKNVGWRIDYFLVSSALEPKISKTAIAPEVMGSDHCPVILEL